jgi:Ca-activated chloride channel family protein
VPDVLSDRPVIVFGKWRGQPNGKVTLNGISGNGSYREVIDVRTVKSSKTLSALRYLWARHRIALLSDYNKLRPNDQRIKQVTDLGLAYNLLTAYTSFIAVDTEVRNNTGQATMVKQPLPLPQGVSDYAVGGLRTSLAPAALSMSRKAVPTESADRALLQESKSKEEQKMRITVGEIVVSEGLSQEGTRKVVEKNIPDMGKCLLEGDPGKKVVIELTVSPDGKIKTAKIISPSFKSKSIEPCLLGQIKKWQFPASHNGQEGKVTLTFVLGS